MKKKITLDLALIKVWVQSYYPYRDSNFQPFNTSDEYQRNK